MAKETGIARLLAVALTLPCSGLAQESATQRFDSDVEKVELPALPLEEDRKKDAYEKYKISVHSPIQPGIFQGSPDGSPSDDGIETWPLRKIYGISESIAGKDRTDSWIKKGIDSLQRNAYRKYYIEEGYFLLPIPDPADPHPRRHDPTLYLPDDPKKDPHVILVRDIDRRGDDAAGMSAAIQGALHSGDSDLVHLAGRSLFDSRFTQKYWSYDLAEKKFGEKSYYYRIRQRRLTRITAEGGVGRAFQAGDSPYYLGASLGAQADSRYLMGRNEFAQDLVPKAKVGIWGKIPFLSGASAGLSALEAWHEGGGLFETEFRLGFFKGSENSSLAAFAFQKFYGKTPLSPESRSSGAQLFYSPNSAVAAFLTYDRAEGSAGSKSEDRCLAGVEFLKDRQKANLGRIAEDIIGQEKEGKGLESLYANAERALGDLASYKPQGLSAQDYLNFLRSKILEPQEPLVLELEGGLKYSIPLPKLLEAARSMEKWDLSHQADAGTLPGWALAEVPERSGEEVVGDLFKNLPQDFPSRPLEEVLLDYASALRRSVDYRVTQATLFLVAAAQIASENPSLRFSPYGSEAETRLTLFNRLDPSRKKEIKGILEKASCWLKQEFKLEGKKLEKMGVKD